MIDPESMRRRDEEKRARYRDMSLEQRVGIMAEVCRMAMRQMAYHTDPEAIRQYRVPMPESSVALWKRLRGEYARPGESA